jgi:hypothetical protein
LNAKRSNDDQAATPVFFQRTSDPISQVAKFTPVHALHFAHMSFTTPLTTDATTKQRANPHRSFNYQWLPPTSLPDPLLLCHRPNACCFRIFHCSPHTPSPKGIALYVYKCTCGNVSGKVDAQTPFPISQCSTTVNHARPHLFNGTMFGQVFSSPIPNPLAPMTIHHPPATATFLPKPEVVFQDNAALPQCSTIKANALPHWFMGTMFGQVFYSTVTVAPKPEAVAPPPVAIVIATPIYPIYPTGPISVVASTPVPTTALFRFLQLCLFQFHPMVSYFLHNVFPTHDCAMTSSKASLSLFYITTSQPLFL